MAATQHTAIVRGNGFLEIAQGIQEQLGLHPGDEVEIVLLNEPKDGGSSLSASPSTEQGGSLYDLLESIIGSVEGSGENYSEQTGAKFTEYLAAKHAEGHL